MNSWLPQSPQNHRVARSEDANPLAAPCTTANRPGVTCTQATTGAPPAFRHCAQWQ
jgi:hypothetical protein